MSSSVSVRRDDCGGEGPEGAGRAGGEGRRTFTVIFSPSVDGPPLFLALLFHFFFLIFFFLEAGSRGGSRQSPGMGDPFSGVEAGTEKVEVDRLEQTGGSSRESGAREGRGGEAFALA